MARVIDGLVSVHYNATPDVSCVIQVQETALSAHKAITTEINVNIIATLNVLTKHVTILQENALHAKRVILEHYVIVHAVVLAQQVAVIRILENVMHV